MKTKIICVLCCTVVAFLAATACGTSDGSTEKASSSNDVSSNETISVIDSELDNKLLENEKNVAGNGYIIINDENDYPAYYNVPLVKTQMKKIIVTAKTLYSHPKNVSKIYAALHTDLAW